MKPITHARKAMMLAYFDLLEAQLRRALKEAAVTGAPTGEAPFIQSVAARVMARLAEVAAEIPDASPPTLPQVRKNLENVLEAAATGVATDPIAALRALRQELKFQPEYTPPKGGKWNPARRAHRRKSG